MIRVTSIIKEIILPPNYYDGLVDTTKGTYVHQAISYLVNDNLDETSLDKRLVPYIEAFKKFMADNKFKPIVAEKTLESKIYGYQGTPDLIGEMNGDRWVVDIKTGRPEKWHAIQLCAYKKLVNENGNGLGPVDRLANLYLNNGKYKFIEISYLEQEEGEAIFLSALKIWNFRKQIRR